MSEDTAINPSRSLSILNEMGDVTLFWDEENDEEVIGYIRDQIKKGVSFFEIKQLPIIPIKYKSKVSDPGEIKGRTVDVKDKDLNKLIADGKLQLGKRKGQEKQIEGEQRISTAEEVVKRNTVGVRQLVGG
jgi:hypothetical protein